MQIIREVWLARLKIRSAFSKRCFTQNVAEGFNFVPSVPKQNFQICITLPLYLYYQTFYFTGSRFLYDDLSYINEA